MDVGEPQRTVFVEPIELPEPLRQEPERVPEKQPEEEPVHDAGKAQTQNSRS
jgi:hypothetical protein